MASPGSGVEHHSATGSPSGRLSSRRRSGQRAAFTLVEATISLAVMAAASSAILLSMTNGIGSTDRQWRRAVADGLAQQLMDEISGMRYMERGVSPTATALGTDGAEAAGPGRSEYDDIDDYNGLRTSPPKDRWNATVGADVNNGVARFPSLTLGSSLMNRWKQEVDVYYVDATNFNTRLSGTSTSNYRAAEVRILYNDPTSGWTTISTLRRVFAYVPEP